MSIIDMITGKNRDFPFSPGGDDADADILDTLKKEHDEAAELLKQLVANDRAAERKALLRQLRSALVPHLRAEEKIVYNGIYAVKDQDAKRDSAEGYMEHQLAEKMLVTLEHIDNAMSPEFAAGSKVLKEMITHHVEEEESNVWKDVKQHFSSDDRIAMNRKFLALKKQVQTAAT
ncbi:MAG TPA: hemerythrin domain-containing protein [Stellaceae bacterium]|jgi:iron-sulfur cluster repair protein YtfE (RIC family)|nr:hemerythrin domain-containing protein [Stellaceae bacterium]